MSTSIKKSLQLYLLLFLTCNSIMHAMEIEPSNIKPKRPTIKADVYFEPLSPAFYGTEQYIQFINKKGIPTPIQPILRLVSTVIVHENSEKQTDWRKSIPCSIQNYYTQSENNKNLNILTQKQKNFKAQGNKLFPRFLPAELAFNCTNDSKINLVIDTFPIEITFASKNDFYAEHQQSLSLFFETPTDASPKEHIKELVTSGKLCQIEFPGFLQFDHHIIPITYIDYTHGPNGCPNEQAFIQSMINNKIPTHPQFKSIMNRELTGFFRKHS